MPHQPSLLDVPIPVRSSTSRVPIEDYDRMTSLKHRVFALLFVERHWWSLRELSDRTGGLQTSVSMRLREITYDQPGGYTVEKENRGKGLWLYRLVKAEE